LSPPQAVRHSVANDGTAIVISALPLDTVARAESPGKPSESRRACWSANVYVPGGTLSNENRPRESVTAFNALPMMATNASLMGSPRRLSYATPRTLTNSREGRLCALARSDATSARPVPTRNVRSSMRDAPG
jgi:hypothetical protein